MRGLSIIQNNASGYNNIIDEYCYRIDEHHIRYALMDLENPVFEPKDYPDFVLVQKKAFSLNYRDLALSVIIQKQLDAADVKERLNYAIGSDFSGIVVDKGVNVDCFDIGDKVIPNSNYPYSEYPNILPGIPTNQGSKEYEILHKSKLLKIPDLMTFQEGAAFTIGFQTVYSMIDRLEIIKNGRVLIMAGTSNTSLFAINSLCKYSDVDIVVVVRSQDGKDRITQLGLNIKRIIVSSGEEKSLLDNKEINSYINEKGGFQYVIDPFMDANLIKVMPAMAMFGKYISCGISNQFNGDFITKLPAVIFGIIIMKNISIIGNCLGSTEHLANALDDFSLGKIQVPIKETTDIDISSFINKSFSKRDGIGKVVFNY